MGLERNLQRKVGVRSKARRLPILAGSVRPGIVGDRGLTNDTVDAIMEEPVHPPGHMYAGKPIVSCNCVLSYLDQAKLVK